MNITYYNGVCVTAFADDTSLSTLVRNGWNVLVKHHRGDVDGSFVMCVLTALTLVFLQMALLALVLSSWPSRCFTTSRAKAALHQNCSTRAMFSPSGSGWQWPSPVPCIKERKACWSSRSRSAASCRSGSAKQTLDLINLSPGSESFSSSLSVRFNRTHQSSLHLRSFLWLSQRSAWMSAFQAPHLSLCPARRAS